MASLITHALLGAAFGQAAKPSGMKNRAFPAICVLCSMLPDIDVIGFSFGVHYGDLWGHRGMTHSLLFAAVVAACVAVMVREGWKSGFLLFLITASHGVLDAMTNGGLDVAFFSPFDSARYFFPWRPIAVSPIGAGRFFSARGIHVLWTEIVWLWGPILLLSGVIWAWRRTRTGTGAVSQ